jgi:type I restriction enzyme, S subunit
MKIERYEAYKDSGIEWLGNVPKHWEEKRVKDVALLERGKFTHRPRNDPQMYDGNHPFIQTGDVARATKYVTTHKQTLSDKGTTVSKWFPKGTLVMTIAANIGDVSIVGFNTYFPDSIVACKPKRNDIDYLFYLFFATKHELDKVKITNTQDNLNLERLNSLIKFIPPLSEQKLIAHYLDTKTAQIDRKIDLLTQKATQYGNLKQSLINETVTRGLDKSVPMKDSSIEWLGDVPEHWTVDKLKRITNVKRGASPRPIDDPKYFDDINGEYGWVRIEDVTKSSKYLLVTKEKLSTLGSSKSVKMKSGDIFLSIAGSVGKPIISKIDCCIHDGFVYFVGLRQNKNFIYYVFNCANIYAGLGKIGTQLNLNTEIVGGISIPVPPLSEQKAIADYLDTKTAQIDQIIQTINAQIEKLKELRKTLINDVVTGKIRVIEDDPSSHTKPSIT